MNVFRPSDRSRRTHRFQGVQSVALCLLLSAILWGMVTPASAAERLRIGGTGSALATMRLLSNAYGKGHGGAEVEIVPNLGSGGGIKAVFSGALDIAVTSRPLTNDEKVRGLVEHEYARTPFFFAVSPENGAVSLTLAEIEALYGGETKTWADGRPVRLILRPAADFDTELLQRMSPKMATAVPQAIAKPGMIMATTDQDCAEKIEKTPGAIGALTLSLLLTEKRNVKRLKFNGIEATPKAISDGTYPYYKKLYFVVKGTPPQKAQRFMDFVSSKLGRAILLQTGHVVPGQ